MYRLRYSCVFWVTRDSERFLVVTSILSDSLTSFYIPTLIAEKSHEIVQISFFRTTCLLIVLCGEFYVNIIVILTSKIKHFEERQVVYSSYSAYEYMYKQREVQSSGFHSNWNIARPEGCHSTI
jgi:hypothetical protein